MKLSKKAEKELLQVYDAWWHSYLNADIKTYNAYLDDDFRFVGSTDGEEFLNRKDTTAFFEATADQLAGKAKLDNVVRTIEPLEGMVLITDLADAYILDGTNWVYYARFRFTSLMRNTLNGWRFFYQHFSTPDLKAEEGETLGLDKITNENLELRNAIKRRTAELELKNRDLEVEASLERIRAQVTSMSQSSDLLDIVVTMRTEFVKLGHEAHYFWHMRWLPEKYEKAMTSGDGTRIGFVMQLPRHIHGDIPLLANWEKSNDATVVYTMNVEEAIAYVDKMVNLGDFQSIDPQAPTHDDIRHIDGLTFIMARTTHGEIGYSLPGVVKNPPKEDLDILMRFAGAFDLAHKRFEDLRKSEEQAREVQIELGLEKVRSRAMAMQNSSELSDLVDTVFTELAILDFALQACIINLIDIDNLCNTVWMKSPDVGNIPDSYLMKFEDYPFHDAMKEGYLKRESKFIYTIQGTEKKKYDKYLFTETEFRKISKDAQDSFKSLEKYVCSFTFSNFGGLQTIGQEPLSDENLDILTRFGKVFDLTYTRFNDLKLAEAQARESGIELALERVRARTMAMQESHELGDVATVLFKELNTLVENLWTCGFVLCEKDRNEDEWWLSTEEGFIPPLFLPNVGDDTHHNIYEAWKNGATYHTEKLEGDALHEHYDWLMTIPAAKEVFDDMKASGIDRPSWQKLHCAYFSYGYLVMITEVPCPEEEIFKRFAKVFDQTYTRFLDLQKAEKQARETEIELALERVRARTMAMQQSEELAEVATVLFQQVGELGIPQWTCGFNIWETGDTHFTFYPGGPDGEILASCKVPLTEHPIFRQFDESKKRGDELLVYEKEGEIQADHYRYMHSLPGIGDMLQGMLDSGLEFPTYQIDHVANFLYGNIIFITYEPFPEMHDVFKRFAKVFEQTYTRFLDLQKAEAQAREGEIEIALERVRSRSMGMQKSEELKEVIQVIFNQLGLLHINAEHAGIVVDYKAREDWHFWVAETQDIPSQITVPYLDSVWDRQFTEAKKEGKDFFTTQLNFEEKNKFYEKMLPYIPGLTKKARDFYLMCPGLSISTVIQEDIGLYIENFDVTPYSKEENIVLRRFGMVFQQTYTRFLDLQKAEAQAYEAQIEAALERVRARSMAMHNSSEMLEVADVLFQQLRSLGGSLWGCGVVICQKEVDDDEVWFANEKGVLPPITMPHTEDSTHHKMYKGWLNKLELYSEFKEGKELEAHYDYMLSVPNVKPLFENILASGLSFPTWQKWHAAYFKFGYLLIITLEPYKDEKIFARFAKVFDQAYTRFLDLQKAEAQAREAQIETALEKVRSRTMAMQKGEEVKDVVVLLYKELIKLGVTNFASCGYVEINEKTKLQSTWVTNPGGDSLGLFYLPLTGDVHFDERYRAWKKQQTVFHQTVAGKERKKHLAYAITTFNSKEAEEMVLNQFPDPTVFYCFNFSHGYLHVVAGSYLTEEEEALLARFTRVFEQTYARFLDLQKAEAQAREAQIETALERVRSRTMAMHNSSELAETAAVLFQQLKELGIDHERTNIGIVDEANGIIDFWLTTQKGNLVDKTFSASIDESNTLKTIYKGYKEKRKSIIVEQKGIELKRWISFITDKLGIPYTSPTKNEIRVQNVGYISQGMLIATSTNPLNDESVRILERFAAVFEQTYTRFMDLQKAEGQAREAQIEASLERIRARSMAMHNSDELREVVATIFEQLQVLKFESSACNIIIYDKESGDSLYWVAGFSQEIYPLSYYVPFVNHTYYKSQLADWKKGKPYAVLTYSGSTKKEFDKIWFSKTDFKNIPAKPKRVMKALDAVTLSTAYIKFGALQALGPSALSDENEKILQRFGNAFEQTYTRFLDLQKVEAQAREAQIEAALERVRSKTMAMHNSQDVGATIGAMFDELVKLGIEKSVRCGIGILDHTKPMELWTASSNSEGEIILSIGFLDMTIHPLLKGVKKAWEKKETNFTYELKGKDLLKYFTVLNESPDYHFHVDLESLPKKTIHNSFLFSEGTLFAFSPDPLTKEEEQIFKRFSGVFAQTYRRYLDLLRAEAQAREAQIEAALERVRSQTMAMHNSQDVGKTVVTFFDEVMKLGLNKGIRCGIGILEDREKMETWSATSYPNGDVDLQVGLLDMKRHPLIKGLETAWKNKEDGYVGKLIGEDVVRYYEQLIEEPDYPFHVDLDNLSDIEYHRSFFFSSGIIFTFTKTPLSEEAALVLKRFASVFGQTYRRFLDLQKAEEQAREARVEAALEKVRARTMAMQASSELQEAANLLFLEIQDLGINAWSAGYNILSEDKTSSTCWMSSEGELQDPFPLFFTQEASFIEMGDFLKSDADFFVQELGGKALKQHYDYMISIPELEDTFNHIQDAGLTLPTYQINHLCKFSRGFLLFITYEKVPDAHEIFKRFTKVFEQTYTRFLDLQKAESQSKESQIELALERVRASSMAMHKSEQLAETAEVLFEQFDLLGIIPDRISIAIYNEKKSLFELWSTDQNGNLVNHGHDFSIEEPTCMAKTYKAWKEGKETFTVDLKGKELEDWISYVKDEAKMELDASQFQGRRVQHAAFFSQGYLLLSSHLPISDETEQLLVRFTKVFQQTYTRFLDLQKAETQAREAIKRTSVDRVRAEIASMRTGTDLNRITPLVWNELTTLDVPFIRCGVFIMDEESQQIQTHLSTPDGKAIASFQLPYENTAPLDQLLPHWRRKEMYRDFWDEEAFIESTKILMQRGAITSSEKYITENQPTSLYLHFLPFLQGMLYVGSEVSLNKDELNLVQNLAEAFSSAYARYEDFNKLELANKKIEKTLVDLKQTQAQLIQSEKMASLGELTAGIAHEIQNPLNFVNNFSEVSHELMKEMQEEIENGDLAEAKEIGHDIEQNLEKINHHGQRASEIVKGMLQHSRSSSGNKELTDINALADEYLRLAYHGLRAKDKTFNAKLETEFDPALEKINLIQQDIGRVILNLITNAFYAVNEKKNQEIAGYEPKVSVRTKMIKDSIEISVEDNGNGIPKKALDKIFQPFFTTKPTGQGTGLGLSLSYDIVKAHGGELKVETNEGEGTEFKIVLPV